MLYTEQAKNDPEIAELAEQRAALLARQVEAGWIGIVRKRDQEKARDRRGRAIRDRS